MVEKHRYLIPQPMATFDAPNYMPPQPRLANGERIQVTAFLDQDNKIVERWQFSDSEVKWYAVEEKSRDKQTRAA